MRVTFVIPEANMSGGVRMVSLYARWLQDRGHIVTVVSIPPHVPTGRERARTLIREGRWLRTPGRASHLDSLSIEHRVLERRRAVMDADVPDADVIIATWWETAEWVAAMGPEKGAKVYFIQGDESAFYPENDSQSRKRVVASLGLPMHRIAVSQWLADRYRDRGAGSIAVVRNGISLDRFPFVARDRRPRFRVGYIYSQPSLKGPDIAREAVRAARSEVPGLEVLVFGAEPPSRGELPEGAEFVCAPPQETIPRLYAGVDAWLFPSRSEGFGLPVIEAMACGTPVIACPVGVATEALGTGGGILLERSDAQEMARGIVRMSGTSGEAWLAMSRCARAIAEGYAWEESAAAFEVELARAAGARVEEAVHA